MVKIQLKYLNPNPFKKEINGGVLNEEQVEKIIANLDKLKLMGSIPVVKRKDKYYLVSHHHRIEALKRKFGKDYQVEVTIHDYNDEELFRGMVVENLSQRNSEFIETSENIDAIEKFLNKNKEILDSLRESRNLSKKDSLGRTNSNLVREKATASDIAKWLDDNSGKVISHDTIRDIMNVNHNLHPDLKEFVEKKHNKSEEERRDGTLNQSQAIILARIEDQTEQKKLAKALTTSEEQRVREQGRLLNEYKSASEDIKEKVLSGDLDLKEVPIEKLKEDIKKKIEEEKEDNKGKITITHYRTYERESGNRIGKTNDEILKTVAYLNGLDNSGILLELDWKTMLKVIEAGTNSSKNYNKYMEKILRKIK